MEQKYIKPDKYVSSVWQYIGVEGTGDNSKAAPLKRMTTGPESVLQGLVLRRTLSFNHLRRVNQS